MLFNQIVFFFRSLHLSFSGRSTLFVSCCVQSCENYVPNAISSTRTQSLGQVFQLRKKPESVSCGNESSKKDFVPPKPSVV